MRGGLFSLAMLLLWVSSARAGNMDSANAAYQRGDWEQAIADYQALVDSGVVHEDLYYDLGNANFRAGRYGEAIFNYERALRVAPGQADALYNLEVAQQAVAADSRSQLRGAEKNAWWVRLAIYFSIAETTLALLVLNFLFFAGLVALRFWVPGFIRTAIAVVVVFLGLGTVSSGVLLAAHVHVNDNILHGIVIGDQVVMREGPDADLEERGQLHPGLRVTVLAREPAWLLVRLANGVEGWVPRHLIGLF
jgi:hypothetical protein